MDPTAHRCQPQGHDVRTGCPRLPNRRGAQPLPGPHVGRTTDWSSCTAATPWTRSPRNTVRDWVKRGLPTNDDRRPMLIRGPDLIAFLQARRLQNKRSCQAGQIYCVRCRTPKNPAGATVDYQPITATSGSLVGICPTCESMMYRRVNLAQLDQVRGELEVTLPQADRRLPLLHPQPPRKMRVIMSTSLPLADPAQTQ
jgi:hypothetical protein